MSHGEGAQDLVKDKKSEVSVKRKIQSLKQNKTKQTQSIQRKRADISRVYSQKRRTEKEFNPFMILEL